MFRSRLILCVTALGLCSAGAVLATNQNSNNFRNDDSTFAPATYISGSTNFQLNSSVEAIAGWQQSLGFTLMAGVPLGRAPAVIPPGAGVGGIPTSPAGSQTGTGYATTTTGNAILPIPTLTFRSPTFKSHQLIGGMRTAAETTIVVNGASTGVSYPAPDRWQLDFPLFLGYNDIFVYAKDAQGNTSPMVGGQIKRLLIGDVNSDRVVNDRDLSLFTRAWNKYNPFADFNEDGLIGDADLSLLASHWGMRY